MIDTVTQWNIEMPGYQTIYTVRSRSSRTKAIKTKKKKRCVFFSVYLFKIGSIRCNTQVRSCFQLLHGIRKKSSEGILFNWSVTAFWISSIVSNLAPFRFYFTFGNRTQSGGDKSGECGGGAMLRLVFQSETVDLLLPNAPGRCAGGKNHECGTGRDELVECAKLGCVTHLYNILH